MASSSNVSNGHDRILRRLERLSETNLKVSLRSLRETREMRKMFEAEQREAREMRKAFAAGQRDVQGMFQALAQIQVSLSRNMDRIVALLERNGGNGRPRGNGHSRTNGH